MRPKNEVAGELSADFITGTSTRFELVSVSAFPDEGIVRLENGGEWILRRYSSRDTTNHYLEGLSNAEDIHQSSSPGTFSAGTYVDLVIAADYITELESDLNDHKDNDDDPHVYLDQATSGEFEGIRYKLVVEDGEGFLEVVEVP